MKTPPVMNWRRLLWIGNASHLQRFGQQTVYLVPDKATQPVSHPQSARRPR